MLAKLVASEKAAPGALPRRNVLGWMAACVVGERPRHAASAWPARCVARRCGWRRHAASGCIHLEDGCGAGRTLPLAATRALAGIAAVTAPGLSPPRLTAKQVLFLAGSV